MWFPTVTKEMKATYPKGLHKAKKKFQFLPQSSDILQKNHLFANSVDAAILTHISLASHFWDIGKQCRPKSDDQGLHYLLRGNFYQK